MPTRSLKAMPVDALMALREQVDLQLAKRRVELEEQIERIGAGVRRRGRPAGRRAHALRGRKVPPKYRGPGGETWAGRGARPRWLVALLKQGRKVQDFAIDKAAASSKRSAPKAKKRVKRSRRKK
jgi:DNA-binding protein H-NS